MIEDSVRLGIGADIDDTRIDDSSFGGEDHVPEDGLMATISDEKGYIELGPEDGAITILSNERELAAHEPEDGPMTVSHEKESTAHDGSEDPYIGMQFESEQAAMIYYDAYAKRIGFVIRVGNCHRSGRDNSIISRRFLCNKEGFRLANNKTKRNENRKPRETTREGCNAMIMVRREKSGKWVISKLETEHCHPLGLPAAKGRRGSVQARPQDEKDKKIRELTLELHRANLRLAECREQLDMILNDAERHTDHLSKTVQDIVENVKEIEAEDQDEPSYHRPI
ncbi:Far1-related sequence [Thalictrum thalictroides]|uniref:Far1-related sequence n=1 Tax=Thalictrum thalictroides TaxID=46969 RepID=A0A7J6X059_THATH|nr:Far1-related sequence [Thalictrum thalictroides]